MARNSRKSKYADMTPVERSIFSRQRGIDRMKRNIEEVKQRAAKDIAQVEARIREKQILLDALKRGNLPK